MDEQNILKKWFKDHLNPTCKELKLWMEDADSFEPEQDWDIIIGNRGMLLAFVKLASNDGPQREDIVHYLHVATADAFMHDRERIVEAIDYVLDDAFSDLLEWKKKASYLLESPTSFRAKEWFEYRYR